MYLLFRESFSILLPDKWLSSFEITTHSYKGTNQEF
jgi:hypothetical protein